MQRIKFELPENTTATLSIEDNWAVVEVVPIKTELEVGKWYYFNKSGWYGLFKSSDDYRENRAIHKSGNWSEAMSMSSIKGWQLANPKEVSSLLIGEAEKRGYTHGTSIESLLGYVGVVLSINGSTRIDSRGFWRMGCLILDFETGKWAEIIPEKKPLYTNSYGTEFFEGDEYWYVSKDTAKVYGPNTTNTDLYGEHSKYSEMFGSRDDCYKWISNKLK